MACSESKCLTNQAAQVQSRKSKISSYSYPQILSPSMKCKRKNSKTKTVMADFLTLQQIPKETKRKVFGKSRKLLKAYGTAERIHKAVGKYQIREKCLMKETMSKMN